jgi:PiT family inorganic phosphate transporter
MTIGLVIVAGIVLVLAWANGANDIAKGVATVVGNGTAKARHGVLWGSLWTALGGLAAVLWGTALLQAFSGGYLSPGFQVDMGFVFSVVMGAVLWVLGASLFGLPVSTTHALLGGLVGATMVRAGPGGLLVGAVANKALLPLLLSPLIAVLLCAALLYLARWVARKLPRWSPVCCERREWLRNPFVCAEHEGVERPSPRVERAWTALHWLSSGATSFARGLNDTPKIAAFLVLALTLSPGLRLADQPLTTSLAIVAVVAAMTLGCLWGGFRVLEVMAHRITPMDASSGLVANLGTSALVLLASPFGLPVSTTHVSAGSLMGLRWADKRKPESGDALRMVLLGWLVTLPVAAIFAATSAWILA